MNARWVPLVDLRSPTAQTLAAHAQARSWQVDAVQENWSEQPGCIDENLHMTRRVDGCTHTVNVAFDAVDKEGQPAQVVWAWKVNDNAGRYLRGERGVTLEGARQMIELLGCIDLRVA